MPGLDTLVRKEIIFLCLESNQDSSVSILYPSDDTESYAVAPVWYKHFIVYDLCKGALHSLQYMADGSNRSSRTCCSQHIVMSPVATF